MPKRFFFWDALPKSGYGKVPKRLVRDELEARGLLDLTAKTSRLMRRIVQPGPPAPERIQWVEARGRAFAFTLEAGLPLLEAARRGFAAEGFAGGTLNIGAGALGPFAYVMPALSKTGENAAFYSDTFRPAGVTRLKMGAMTLGQRDGAPFFHCHALVDRSRRARRRRPYPAGGDRGRRAFRGRSVRHRRRGVHGGARPRDQFQIVRAGARRPRQAPKQPAAPSRCGCGRTRILPARWRHSAASAASPARRTSRRRRQHHRRALCRWPHRRAVRDRDWRSRPGRSHRAPAAWPEAELDVALVDYTGGLAEGRLMRGDNPVLMTMELVLEVLVVAALSPVIKPRAVCYGRNCSYFVPCACLQTRAMDAETTLWS